ncbi:hypothetical protein Ocin01_09327 [Orchesella cincta]|uniref:Uncharacterized protein n=1 Tax=Orchesella cincta TaxID=48709 RepID=A0A1D2MWP3_ORCCI|nr:hypothetical protein Ocin01_09327 [Orchesella cincta]
MSYHRRRSIPLSRGFRIRSKSRLPGNGCLHQVPLIQTQTNSSKFHPLFHSNPALEFTEFIISSPFGSLQFDEAISILVAPARFFSPEYLDEAVFRAVDRTQSNSG